MENDYQQKPPLLKVIIDGQERDISFEELCLTNNLSQEALVILLIKKKIITPEEFMEELQHLEKERLQPPPSS
ncbi:hypothetical protein JW877_00745 [bacterium]|nr:hypothetical protein [bacterium]